MHVRTAVVREPFTFTDGKGARRTVMKGETIRDAADLEKIEGTPHEHHVVYSHHEVADEPAAAAEAEGEAHAT